MNACYYYCFIEPVREVLNDPKNSVVGFTHSYKVSDRILEFAFLLYEDRQPFAIRFRIPSLEKDEIPEDCLTAIQTIKEHFLSTLRIIGYDRNITYAPHPAWNFINESIGSDLQLTYSLTLRPPNTCY
jgi:hypothetical protein